MKVEKEFQKHGWNGSCVSSSRHSSAEKMKHVPWVSVVFCKTHVTQAELPVSGDE